MSIDLQFLLVLFTAAAFGLTNGFLDGGSLVSTVVMTRALEPIWAILLVAGSGTLGLFVLGHAVAATIGRQLIAFPAGTTPSAAMQTILCGVSGALLWNFLMWRMKQPSSSSHALMGGIAGATLCRFGSSSLEWALFSRIALLLILIPFAALLASVILVKVTYFLGGFLEPVVGRLIRVLQIAALAALSAVNGSNNGQKSTGVMFLAAAAMASAGKQVSTGTFVWLAAAALALGVILGSRRTLETAGRRFLKIQEEQGFCAQMATMYLVGISSLAGYPISTGHTMSAAIVGAGVGLRPRAVRWSVVGELGFAGLLTIPSSAAVGALLTVLAREIDRVVS